MPRRPVGCEACQTPAEFAANSGLVPCEAWLLLMLERPWPGQLAVYWLLRRPRQLTLRWALGWLAGQLALPWLLLGLLRRICDGSCTCDLSFTFSNAVPNQGFQEGFKLHGFGKLPTADFYRSRRCNRSRRVERRPRIITRRAANRALVIASLDQLQMALLVEKMRASETNHAVVLVVWGEAFQRNRTPLLFLPFRQIEDEADA